ncbi:hypothetical protein PBRA_002448 [Plasmodiophora brassicae]|uniref:Uncharacterized protein n=1 Tax=Plasmodiophora brassicae TaxID=37360 RepID=A0A0G4J3J3_PLABS|nr:hypothetical protein PBRA_002448 [Plasmodiophora brassicae]
MDDDGGPAFDHCLIAALMKSLATKTPSRLTYSKESIALIARYLQIFVEDANTRSFSDALETDSETVEAGNFESIMSLLRLDYR